MRPNIWYRDKSKSLSHWQSQTQLRYLYSPIEILLYGDVRKKNLCWETRRIDTDVNKKLSGIDSPHLNYVDVHSSGVALHRAVTKYMEKAYTSMDHAQWEP